MHLFRFGVMASWADSAAAWTALARRAAELGYSVLLIPDHMRRQLQARRDRLGISYCAIPGRAMETMAPLVAALAGS